MHIFRERQKDSVTESFLQKYCRCSETWPPRVSLILLVMFGLLDILKVENGIMKRHLIIIFKITFLVTLGNRKKILKIMKNAAKIIEDTTYIEMPY